MAALIVLAIGAAYAATLERGRPVSPLLAAYITGAALLVIVAAIQAA